MRAGGEESNFWGAVEEAEVDGVGGRGEGDLMHDGTGGDAVAPPDAGKDEDGHVAAEGLEEGVLLGCEGDGFVGGGPACLWSGVAYFWRKGGKGGHGRSGGRS